MLMLQGERDYQVMAEEFAQWKAALRSRPDVTFHSYPALNHFFSAGAGPSLPAEYLIPGHVAEDVIRDIAAWVAAARPQLARGCLNASASDVPSCPRAPGQQSRSVGRSPANTV